MATQSEQIAEVNSAGIVRTEVTALQLQRCVKPQKAFWLFYIAKDTGRMRIYSTLVPWAAAQHAYSSTVCDHCALKLIVV